MRGPTVGYGDVHALRETLPVTDSPNPLAPHHLPWFITGPGQTDILFVAVTIFVIAVVLVFGNLYFKLHHLPERMAHEGNRIQFQIVAVLALLAMFTHNNLFWIAALLLALVKFPDYSTPINSMAQSLETLVRRSRPSLPEFKEKAEPVLEGTPLPPPVRLVAQRVEE